MFHEAEANKIENIITMLNLLEEHFLNEYPFFTFYLPENIKEFEDFILIRDDGNCCEIIVKFVLFIYLKFIIKLFFKKIFIYKTI